MINSFLTIHSKHSLNIQILGKVDRFLLFAYLTIYSSNSWFEYSLYKAALLQWTTHIAPHLMIRPCDVFLRHRHATICPVGDRQIFITGTETPFWFHVSPNLRRSSLMLVASKRSRPLREAQDVLLRSILWRPAPWQKIITHLAWLGSHFATCHGMQT